MCVFVWFTSCAAFADHFLFNVTRGQCDGPIIWRAPPREIVLLHVSCPSVPKQGVAEAVKKDLIQRRWSGTSSHPTVSAAAATEAWGALARGWKDIVEKMSR